MIIVFEGTPGSGKSYDAVRKIIDNLRKGRAVYTNIEGMDDPVHQEHLKVHCGLDDYQFSEQFHFIDGPDAREFWKVAKKGSLIVIDEAHKLYNARDWQTKLNRDCANWCSTHRHEGYDGVFITQAIEKLDSQIRTLVEWTYRFRKINFFGSLMQSGYLVYAFSGDDTTKPLQAPAKKLYDKKVFACYKSFVADDIKELGVMNNINILKHPVFYAMPVVLLLFIYFFSKSGFVHGEIIPGQFAAQKKLAAPGPVSSLTPTVPNIAHLPAGSPRVNNHSKQKEKHDRVVSSRCVITGKAEMPGRESVFAYKKKDSLNDNKGSSIMIAQSSLDDICKCNSKKSVDVGYEFDLN